MRMPGFFLLKFKYRGSQSVQPQWHMMYNLNILWQTEMKNEFLSVENIEELDNSNTGTKSRLKYGNLQVFSYLNNQKLHDGKIFQYIMKMI